MSNLSPSNIESEKLLPPDEFPFPFKPYGIQEEFMRELYNTLENGKIGLFESPTGTGKSMSLICGALKWLKDRDERDSVEAEKILSGQQQKYSTNCKQVKSLQKEPDWMRDFGEKHLAREIADRYKEVAEKKLRRQERAKKLKEQYGSSAKHWMEKKLPLSVTEDVSNIEDDDDIVLAEYDSDAAITKGSCDPEECSDDEITEEHVRKVFYCSRTHSQLAQFVHEVQQSPYGAANVQVISMGSRQNMCINDEVKKLKSVQLINDKCLELQKKSAGKKESIIKNNDVIPPMAKRSRSKKTSSGCPFYKSTALSSFSDLALDEVKDIEQLVSMGRELRACPYYGARHSLPSAQLVVLPYQLLLHAATRQAVGISLKDNVVIIDEAHNLLDTISNIHSVHITGAQVQTAHSQLTQYMEKYKIRLKAKNVMYIKQLLFILSRFIKCMTVANFTAAGTEDVTKLMKLNDFLFESHMDNVNLFKLIQYCERSEISRKLNGFVDRYQNDLILHTGSDVNDDKHPGSHDPSSHMIASSPLMIIQSFLNALTNADQDGRIVITKKKNHLNQSFIKFLLLNPGIHFTDIVRESRAVVMVGGTMQPLSEFRDQLLVTAGVASDRVLEFSCGHVIPPDHLLAISLASGPSGQALDFTYESRDSNMQVEELARVITNLCVIVPGGIVCFFPSYDYEKMVCIKWEKTGVMDKIRKKKQVFQEPRSAAQVDDVLTNYTRCIKSSSNKQSPVGGATTTGAILMCVVSGKMSEGINFSNDLGRCVVIIGLPYPNIKSPELAEKMQYLNSTMPKCSDGRQPGQLHYENLCMKAVNQSIGRAIRHSNDYAAILLLDQRYLKSSIIAKLPTWIGHSLQVCDKFGTAFSALRKFYVSKKSIT